MQSSSRSVLQLAGTIFFLCCGVIAVVWFWEHSNDNDVARAAGNPPASMIAPPRDWRPIGRVGIFNGEFQVSRSKTWSVKALTPVPGIQTRFKIAGEFAASEAVAFVVIDPKNVAHMASGYPPLIAYQSNNLVSTPYPAPGSIVGFVCPATAQPAGFPTSTADLALRLIAKVAEANRPPARVTSDVHLYGECLCTEAEAARLFRR